MVMRVMTEIRDFVVGIDYEALEEDKGHMTIRRKVSIRESRYFRTTGLKLNGEIFPPILDIGSRMHAALELMISFVLEPL